MVSEESNGVRGFRVKRLHDEVGLRMIAPCARIPNLRSFTALSFVRPAAARARDSSV